MLTRVLIGLAVSLALLCAACTTSLHGSYVPISYVDDSVDRSLKPIGQARGESCQTRFLYLFPVGPATSTNEAIAAAKLHHEGTSYIADISIDDRRRFEFGYSVQCIIVDAIAY
jgi:hypothetical protein